MAAVHAGVIDTRGGVVQISEGIGKNDVKEIIGDNYMGTLQNGIQSQEGSLSWPAYTVSKLHLLIPNIRNNITNIYFKPVSEPVIQLMLTSHNIE